MMLRKAPIRLAVLAVLAGCTASAQAQFERNFAAYAMSQGAGKEGISATGTTTVQRKPTQLRLYMLLLAKGKTLQEALAKLKQRREAAALQLETLKADKKSIVFGAPSLSSLQSARKRQIEAMVRAQMRSRGKKVPKGLQAPQTVTVSATLTAQWPLEAESQEDMLVMAQGIQDKIKAADLAGGKESETLSAEEEELAEEAGQMASQFGEDQQQPGQPHFLYVATLPKEQREEALAKAFKKAMAQAGEVAKAAGIPLGPLHGVSGMCAGQSDFSDNEYGGYDPSGTANLLRRMMGQQAGGAPEEKQDEALSATPGMLRFHCYATVVFGVGSGK